MRLNDRIGTAIDGIAGDQFDDTVMLTDRIGLQQSALVNDFRAHLDGARIRNQLAVIVHRALREPNARAQAAAIGSFRKQHLLAEKKANLSSGSGDGAVVFDFVGNEKRRTALTNIDMAIVDNFRGGRWSVELPGSAAGEIRHLDRRGSQQQTVRGYGCLPSNIKARRILEDDEAVSIKIAQNLRGIWIVDSIPNQRRGRRLNEGRGFAEANVEALPIDESAIGSANR